MIAWVFATGTLNISSFYPVFHYFISTFSISTKAVVNIFSKNIYKDKKIDHIQFLVDV